VITTALTDLWNGFGVALEPQNLMWCFIGVLIGNMVGVLPGMGPLATISMLLPLTSASSRSVLSSCWRASGTAPNTAAQSARSCSVSRASCAYQI
jgi:hypothetical protein